MVQPNDAIFGKSIILTAPIIEEIPIKDMITSNNFKLCGRYGARQRGHPPTAMINVCLTKTQQSVFGSIQLILSNIQHKLSSKYSKSVCVSNLDKAYIKGNKVFGECEPINVKQKVRVAPVSSQDQGQNMTIYGQPAMCYVDLHVQVKTGAHWVKL